MYPFTDFFDLDDAYIDILTRRVQRIFQQRLVLEAAQDLLLRAARVAAVVVLSRKQRRRQEGCGGSVLCVSLSCLTRVVARVGPHPLHTHCTFSSNDAEDD